MGCLVTLVVLGLSACGGGGGGGQQHSDHQAKIPGCVPGEATARFVPTQYFLDGHLTVTFHKAWVSHEDQGVEFSASPQGEQNGGGVKFWSDIYPVAGKTIDVKHKVKGVPITTAG